MKHEKFIVTDAERTYKLEKIETKSFLRGGDEYWLIEPDGDARLNNWEYTICEYNWLEQGNIAKTELEAKKTAHARALIQAIKVRRRELNGDWIPDWNDSNQAKYYFYYQFGHGAQTEIVVGWTRETLEATSFGFYESRENAETVVKEFKKDLVWFFEQYLPGIN